MSWGITSLQQFSIWQALTKLQDIPGVLKELILGASIRKPWLETNFLLLIRTWKWNDLSRSEMKRVVGINIDLTQSCLLSGCLKGRTQNKNEPFHRKLWKKCLKTKSHGCTSVRFAFHLSALEHNITRDHCTMKYWKEFQNMELSSTLKARDWRHPFQEGRDQRPLRQKVMGMEQGSCKNLIRE